MQLIERQVDRAFRHQPDSTVLFQPSWADAFVVPSPAREVELRDAMRHFTIVCWLFALACPVLGLLGHFALKWLWISTGSLMLLKAAVIVRLIFTLSYFVVGAGWVWWSLRGLTAGLQPTPPSWATAVRLQRAARRNSGSGLALKAATGALVGVGSVIVLIALPSLGRSESAAVASMGLVGLGCYLWYRLVMRARDVGQPNKAAAGDGHRGGIQ